MINTNNQIQTALSYPDFKRQLIETISNETGWFAQNIVLRDDQAMHLWKSDHTPKQACVIMLIETKAQRV